MVQVVHWNPRKALFKEKPFSYIPIKRKVNNFGDLIGPLVVKAMTRGLPRGKVERVKDKRRLLAVGSILHFAKDGDIVWGGGRNGKIGLSEHKFNSLDVRGVRGPLTREFLLKRSIECPEVYGDPGLLLVHLLPAFIMLSKEKKFDFTIVPNLNDFCEYKKDESVINPTSDIFEVISRIAQSRFVIGSSLHSIVVADSLGIPARLIKSEKEPLFKYEDYYLGTARSGCSMARSVSQAIDMGGEPRISSNWDKEKLVDSFPYDLWMK